VKFWKITLEIAAEQVEQVEDLCDEILNETVKGFGLTIESSSIEPDE